MTTRTRRSLLACLVPPVLLVAGLAGCGAIPPSASGGQRPTETPTTGTDGGDTPGQSAPPTTPAPKPEVKLSANVGNGAAAVKVDTVVTAKASGGTLSKVTLSWSGPDSKGVMKSGTVDGSLSKDRVGWTAGDRLEPNATYTLKLSGKTPEGSASNQTTKFTTQKLTLAQQTFPELYPLQGSDVGVGMPVVLRFDVAVKDKKSFQKNLSVTSSPAQNGIWRWYSDKEVHFRPQHYWKPGTTVSVKANLNGVSAGNGIYGQRSTSTSFTIGRSVITKVNLASKQAKVYISGKLARTIPISGGKTGWLTRSGTKLIIDKLYQTRMTNEMIGANEPYDLKVFYAMRVTWSGEFLHAAPWNAGNFGRVNASHGCVGMSTANAAWLYGKVKIGDPVVTTGTSRGLEAGNGYTDWNASWNTYKKGSAL